jgi:hypothetical protein
VIMRATYSKSSPYYQTPQTSTYLDVWNAPPLAPATSDGILLVTDKYKHRPDILSQDLYGTPRLWWVFAMINPNILKDPIYDLQPGLEIRFPDKSQLQGYI